MRLYTFVNFYLSSIQQGIQTAHCVSNLFVMFNDTTTPEGHALHDWGTNHKTIITLNGGNNQTIHETYQHLLDLGGQLNLPVTIFYEDEQSLGGIATSCAILVPEYIYDGVYPEEQIQAADMELHQLLRSHSLAR